MGLIPLIPALGSPRQADQFKIILSYIARLRPGLHETLSQDKETKKQKKNNNPPETHRVAPPVSLPTLPTLPPPPPSAPGPHSQSPLGEVGGDNLTGTKAPATQLGQSHTLAWAPSQQGMLNFPALGTFARG